MLKWLAGLLLCVSATAGAAPRLVYEFDGQCDDARPWTVCHELGVSSLYIKVQVEDIWEPYDGAWFRNVGQVWVKESNLPKATTAGGWRVWALWDGTPEYWYPWSQGIDIFFDGGWIDVNGDEDLLWYSHATLDSGLGTMVLGQWRFVSRIPEPGALALLIAGIAGTWPAWRRPGRPVRCAAPQA